MAILNLTTTPVVIGPLAIAELWTVVDGAITLTLTQPAVTVNLIAGDEYVLNQFDVISVAATTTTGVLRRQEILTQNMTKQITGPAAQSVLDTDLLSGVVSGWIDVRGFLSASITILGSAGIASGQVIFEGTNDTTLSAAGQVLNTAHEVGTNVTTTFAAFNIAANAVRTWIVPCVTNYIRVRISTVFVGGTVQAIANLRRSTIPPFTPNSILVTGNTAHDAAIAGAPVRIAGRALTANYATVSNGDVADLITTLVGALIQKPYAIPEQDIFYVPPVGGLVNTTTAVTIFAAQGAGIRSYITAIQMEVSALTNATEFVIRDGAGGTVLWRLNLETAGVKGGFMVVFPTPLKSTANTLLEICTLTASGAGAAWFNAQGYKAP